MLLIFTLLKVRMLSSFLNILLHNYHGLFQDTKENPDEFSRKFFKGAYEGFWWAFITMTTVG